MLPQQRRPDALLEVAQEVLAPQAQRLGVVAADVLDAVDDQAAAGAGVGAAHQLADRRQVAAGEDVSADEVGALRVRPVPRLRDRDALQHRHAAVRLQEAIDALEVRRQELGAHGLEHLDADHPVVPRRLVRRPRQPPVVAQVHLDAPAQPGRGDARARLARLLDAQRQAGDAAPRAPHRLDREAAPARADLEHVVVRPDARQLDEAAQLGGLRVLERLGGGPRVRHGPPDRARVGHVGRQEGGEHGVADVVVRRHVQARVGQRVGAPRQRRGGGRQRGHERGGVGQGAAVGDEDLRADAPTVSV